WQIDSLPKETRDHLPKFMAAVIISKAPERFGFDNIVYESPLTYDTVSVTEPVGLRIAAQCVGSTYEHLRALNPELRRGYTPPSANRKAYALRVPVGTAEKFKINYARVPAKQKTQMVDYRMQSGETISEIARSVGVRTQAILDANNIRNPRRVRAGTKLTIPIPPERYARASRLQNRIASLTPDPSDYDKSLYTVRRGDTLWDIAKQQGVSPRQIQAWNGIRASQPIHPGNRLAIWKPRKPVSVHDQTIANSTDFYIIQRGDTLWDIARAFDTSIAQLKAWNRIQSGSRIRAGDKLLVRPPQEPKMD
ncbi:MAG: LysM peptidoglycan-binding domain-containing protein, partial [bacterium]|nr:LysM peptidoglycan-binding domain-containing protein [bacterium]